MDQRVGRFVWDLDKELKNVNKHDVKFSEAIKAFNDEKRKVFVDLKHSFHEKRFYCISKVGEGIMTVRFAYHGESIRIIGAGYWRKGRRYYEKENG